MTESNREVVRPAFEAWRVGTSAITDLFAPDMVWRIEGHSLASKEYRGTQQFIDEVLGPFGARFRSGSRFGRSGSERFSPTTTTSWCSGMAVA
ncbi:MAG: nuclear transport factor 2 family protein [Solirubrobacteraceae bacterium]